MKSPHFRAVISTIVWALAGPNAAAITRELTSPLHTNPFAILAIGHLFACCTLKPGHHQFSWIGAAPGFDVRDISLIGFQVDIGGAYLLVEPATHPSGVNTRLVRRHGKVLPARQSRHINQDLGLTGCWYERTDQ